MSYPLYSGLTTAQILTNVGVAAIIDASGNWINSLSGGGGGTGNVTGPVSSTTNAIARYTDTTGQVLSNSSVTIDNSGVITNNGLTLNGAGNVSGASNLNLNAGGNITANSAGTLNLNSVGTMTLEPNTGSGLLEFIASQVTPGYSGQTSLGLINYPWSNVYSNNVIAETEVFSPVISGTLISGTTVSANQYTTPWVSGTYSAATSSYAYNCNAGASQILVFSGVGAGTCAITLSNGVAGSTYALQTVNNLASGVQLSWGNSPRILWQAQASGTMTSGASAVDLFTFFYNGTTFLGNVTNKYL